MRTIRNLFYWVILSLFQPSYAEVFELNTSALHSDARDLALGGLSCNYESIQKNELTVTYLMPFLLKELSIRRLDFKKKAFGLYWNVGWYQSGNEDWMENNLNLHVGKELNEQLYLGVTSNLIMVENVSEGRSSSLFAEIDCRYSFTKTIMISLRVINLGGTHLNSNGVKGALSNSAHMGCCYSPYKKSHLYAEISCEQNHPFRFKFGLEYDVLETFFLRAGFYTNPMLPSWGVGGYIKKWRYSMGWNFHPILGISNGFTLDYFW